MTAFERACLLSSAPRPRRLDSPRCRPEAPLDGLTQMTPHNPVLMYTLRYLESRKGVRLKEFWGYVYAIVPSLSGGSGAVRPGLSRKDPRDRDRLVGRLGIGRQGDDPQH